MKNRSTEWFAKKSRYIKPLVLEIYVIMDTTLDHLTPAARAQNDDKQTLLSIFLLYTTAQ